jgi:hypothetical protein
MAVHEDTIRGGLNLETIPGSMFPAVPLWKTDSGHRNRTHSIEYELQLSGDDLL